MDCRVCGSMSRSKSHFLQASQPTVQLRCDTVFVLFGYFLTFCKVASFTVCDFTTGINRCQSKNRSSWSRGSVPAIQCSSVPAFQRSSVPAFQPSSVPAFQRSKFPCQGTAVQAPTSAVVAFSFHCLWFNVKIKVSLSIGQLAYCVVSM